MAQHVLLLMLFFVSVGCGHRITKIPPPTPTVVVWAHPAHSGEITAKGDVYIEFNRTPRELRLLVTHQSGEEVRGVWSTKDGRGFTFSPSQEWRVRSSYWVHVQNGAYSYMHNFHRGEKEDIQKYRSRYRYGARIQ